MLSKSRVLSVSVLLLAGCSSGPSTNSQEPAPSRAAAAQPALAQQSAATAKGEYTPASVVVAPGASCAIHPEGSKDAALTIPVPVGYDGVARFHAVRPTSAEAVTRLSLDCTLPSGAAKTYPVDLQSGETFAPRPTDLGHAPGMDRPALTGDPRSYSQEELLREGYGLRPDPERGAAAYADWLAAATRPGRLLQVARPEVEAPASEGAGLHPMTTSEGWASPWTGAVLTGAPTYIEAEATFVVPALVPGGDGTTNTQAAIWTGLGGYGTGGGLIQGGVTAYTTSTVASFSSFAEYCCGSPINPPTNLFDPSPGDTIFVQEWYCDQYGSQNADPNNGGGYGCSFIQDTTTGAVVACVNAESTLCPSVPPMSGWVLGESADFVMELQDYAAFPVVSGQLSMSGEAETSSHVWNTISSDPSVTVLEDFTAYDNADHVAVSLSSPNTVNWSVTPWDFSSPTDWYSGGFSGSIATVAADVNGDGKADGVAFNGTSTWVMLSTGSAFSAPTNWYGGGFSGSLATVAADVNGDGKADGVAFNGTSTWVMLSTGSGFSAPTPWYSGGFTGSLATVAADVNGDGMADGVAFNGTSTWVMLSTGSGFAPATRWYSGGFTGSIATVAADVNGDGKADGVAFNGTSTWVMLSTGSGFAPATSWYGGGFSGSLATVAADVDGDGKADGVAFNGTSTWVMLSTGSAFSAARNSYGGAYGFSGSIATVAADVNGDKRADGVAFNGTSTWVMLGL